MPKDEVMAGDKWEFNADVTEVFDDMLSRSIPDYEGMRRTTTELALQFAQKGTDIIDLGCSRGAALKPIIKALGKDNSYVGIEVSEPMLEAAKQEIPEAYVQHFDLRDDYPNVRASVTLAVLTLQFIPIEYRQRIVADAYKKTVQGGIFLLVEKVLGENNVSNQIFIDTYLARKGENGYTREQIANKRKSLEGVLVPITANWNINMMERAGFKHVDCYWRQLNFSAWFGIKE